MAYTVILTFPDKSDPNFPTSDGWKALVVLGDELEPGAELGAQATASAFTDCAILILFRKLKLYLVKMNLTIP